jgi:uncharacterized damage-inducible protein DinB
MTNPVLESARTLVGESLTEMRSAIDGLPAEALNWRPAADTNSIAAMVTHALLASRLWLRMAMGLSLPERDRDAEFRAAPADAAEFRSWVTSVSSECTQALESAEVIDWEAARQTQGRGGNAPPVVPAAHALIHATEHLRGHVDQVALTRQLWDARSSA